MLSPSARTQRNQFLSFTLAPIPFPLAGKGQDRGYGSKPLTSQTIAQKSNRRGAIALAKTSLLAVDGRKFRRQQPLGGYIVDFVCLERRLIVELDGGQHADRNAYDKKRDDWLRNQGFVILRFWNHDVLNNIDGVVKQILDTLKNTPYLNPSPQGGRRLRRRKSGSSSVIL